MAVEKINSSSSLAEVVDRILDKGVVIDAWVRVSLVGIELLAVEARVVIASVETYLKYAEAVGLTALAAAPGEAVDESEIGQPMTSPSLI
ncbi:gas vesicle structural protein GvpA [Dapis sp. BLCC M126]|uniref:gas vesicle structural protein GvpA n=1 Tax=Dapis sp. BLCC M126 TaxID=3400189 RepID=UPI003CF8D5D0